MQIDRLIQIIFLLLSHENITAKALAEELGVSPRTIYRDINILSVAGIPIISQKGYGGGLSLLEGFSLDKSYFTKEEQSNIIQALQILKSSHYPAADKVLNKVAGLFSHHLQSEWLEIDFSCWGSLKKEQNNIAALERAIINKYVITFTYLNSELGVTSQIAEPFKLVFKSHAWYLVAYSQLRKETRTYRMSRMRELQITNERFDRELPRDFSLTPAYREEYQIPLFVLHFSEKIGYKVYDEFQEKDIKRLENGTLEVRFRYQLSEWTLLYLLSFGEYVEIIEPLEARDMLKEKTKRILSLYEQEREGKGTGWNPDAL
ncbi:MAG: YafY family transcriptional regulator [Lachnospiraceae bacterium]|jgi:predicted DNA-binding transcriptional regulator YafY|nr:YafY family transcriptional regulator [Lachnospiraceae bacterium]